MAQGLGSELWISGDPDGVWARPPQVTRLEELAVTYGIAPDLLRERLRDEIQHRLREKGAAWEAFDRTLERRANGR